MFKWVGGIFFNFAKRAFALKKRLFSQKRLEGYLGFDHIVTKVNS